MNESNKKKNNKSYIKKWFNKIIYLNTAISMGCLILFLSLSIALSDYSYLYGTLITLPVGWFLILFYWLFYKNLEFPYSREGLSTYKTTVRFTMLFLFKTLVVFAPLIIVMILYAYGINNIFNLWSVLTCSLLTPLLFFFTRFFMVKNHNKNKGGD